MLDLRLIVIGLLALSFGTNIMLYKWHAEDQLQLKIMRRSNDLQPLSNESSELLNVKYQALKNKFLTNDYNLRYHAPNQPPINVKIIFDAENGVNCVYFDNDKMKYYGYSDEV